MSAISALARGDLPAMREQGGPVFIDVWGPQCKPCLALAPAYDRLAEEFSSSGSFYKLEAPANRMACVDLKVMALPTFLCYRDGQEVSRLSGEISQEELREWVSAAFADTP